MSPKNNEEKVEFLRRSQKRQKSASCNKYFRITVCFYKVPLLVNHFEKEAELRVLRPTRAEKIILFYDDVVLRSLTLTIIGIFNESEII